MKAKVIIDNKHKLILKNLLDFYHIEILNQENNVGTNNIVLMIEGDETNIDLMRNDYKETTKYTLIWKKT
jgi:hypothetical protein